MPAPLLLATLLVGACLGLGLGWLLARRGPAATGQQPAPPAPEEPSVLTEVLGRTAHVVVALDHERGIEWANPAFEALAGRPLAELQGRRLRELGLLAHSPREVIDALARAQDERRAHRCELCLKTPDGGQRWLAVDLQPRTGAAGEPRGFLLMGTDVSAQREALQDLARQQAQMRAVIAGASCGVLHWNLADDQLQVDEQLARMLGRSPEALHQISAEQWRQFMHPDDAERLQQATLTLLRNERQDFVLELRMRHADGSWRWMQVRAAVLDRDRHGGVSRASGIYLDITERHTADERWQTRAELSSDWYWETDAEHRAVEVTGGPLRAMLAVPAEYLGRRRDEIAWFDPPEGGWAAYHAMLDRHRPFRGVTYRARTSGGERWLEIDGRPRFDDDGHFVGYAGVGRDITERRRDTEQLRESVAVLDAIFSSLSVPVFVKDREGILRRVNPTYARMVGLPRERIVGRRTSELLDAAAGALHDTEDAVILASGEGRRYEASIVAPEGSASDLLIYKSPVVDADGHIQGIVGTAIDITERRRAERALERERARLADIIVGANAGVGEWDLVSGAMELDERYCAMLGLAFGDRPRDVAGWRARVHPEDLATMDEHIRRHARGEVDHLAVDLRMRHAKGHWAWVHLRGRIVARDAQGRALRAAGAHFDVTDRRDVVERWRARAQLSGDWFWQTDAQHRFLDLVIGDDVRSLVRVSELIGLRRDEVAWFQPPEGGWQAFHERLDRHEPFKGLVYLNVNRPEDPRWIEIDGRPRRDDAGRFVGYDGIGRDITERRRVTEQLRQSLAQLDSVIGAVPVPLVIKDTQGRNTRVNRAYCEFYGVTEDQVLGCTVFDFWPADLAARYHAEDQALMADRRVRRSQVQTTTHTGQVLDLLVHRSPITTPDGEVIGVISAAIDMSEQRLAARALTEAKDAAEAANRAKSAFLATMSHEIRTPMNGVIGMAELLARGTLDEEQTRQVGTIVDSARALLSILDDILDFSKIEAGRLELELQPLALASLVESACDALLPLALAGGVALHVHVAQDLPAQVLGDATRLRQILNNLVGNAIKFTTRAPAQAARADRPQVQVRLLAAPGGCQLQVQDNGIGIDAATLARLFVPFSQGEVSTTRRFGGTGLGLAIVQRLVDAMQGRIDVSSEPGVGSRFTIQLPLREAGSPGAPAPARQGLHGLRCCLLRGDLAPVEDYARWLRDAGAVVQVIDAGTAPPTDALLLRSQPEPAPTTQAPGHGELGPAELLIGRGRRTDVRLIGPTLAVLDQPRRASLVRAVAVLGGLASPSPIPVAVAPPASSGAAPAGQLILVAEDDPTNRLVIERQLEVLGYRVDMAHDGAEALRRWQGGRHAALLTDLHMPGMDGYKLAQRIRAAEGPDNTTRLPILALTANALKGEALRARAAGIDDYLTKPVPLQMLRAALQHWLPLAIDAAPAVPEQDADDAAEPAAADDGDGLAGSASSWDRDAAARLIGDDDAVLRDLLQDFLAMGGKLVDAIGEALQSRDGGAAAAAAHRLKSSARAVGANELAQVCEAIERLRTLRDADDPASVHLRLARAWQAAHDAIAQHLELP